MNNARLGTQKFNFTEVTADFLWSRQSNPPNTTQKKMTSLVGIHNKKYQHRSVCTELLETSVLNPGVLQKTVLKHCSMANRIILKLYK
jgi:hypothetical protein